MKLALVHIACNDYRNGNFCGRLEAVQYNELELVCAAGSVAISFLPQQRVRISRRVFEYVGRKAWVGNWCWDAISMPKKEAHRLIGYLREAGRWQCEGGPVRLCDWYDRPSVLTQGANDGT